MERIGSDSVCDGVQDSPGGTNVEYVDKGRLPSTPCRNDDVHSGSGVSSNQLSGHLIVGRGFEVEELHSDGILHHFEIDALQANGDPLTLRGAAATEDQSPDVIAVYWITENEDGEDIYHNIAFNRFKEREPYVHRQLSEHARGDEVVSELLADAYERWPELAWQFDPDNYDFDPVREWGTHGGKP